MYKSTYYLFIILFLCVIGYAQDTNYGITYLKTTTSDAHIISAEDKLYISPKEDKSLYINGKYKFTKEPPREPNEIVIYDKQEFEEFFYFDFKKNLLYSRIKPWEARYFIKEDIPQMDWQLHDETKTTKENVLLHKATLSFRGRNYTVWYSMDYPIQIGPWKFNNLPGLAFEITEEDHRYHWQLTKIETNKFKVLPMKYDISRATMTLQTYLTSYQAEVENYDMGLSRLFGSIPGVEVLETITDGNDFKKSRNMDLERKYEWEE
ncbi:hypothetical protein MODO_0211 [Myroides odoratimimus]|uniref:GLPGLI family protein n=1 Tax=Myroides odoratimimus CCUG 10230 TaxID=883150 RepID=A0ABN0ECN3_9FLAO|nr:MULTISPECIES: GLPGLI family protein [Myroides]AJA68712.1 hypothetical protein MYRA21_1559 [Myroides sp. A21]EHO11133.1 hypothetical protein HMPREF9712_00790 [Myroides odoratimimus CCUG 10230]MDM1083869.1 GLPGLI family protein [Myroides odoratimimus]MDM1455518.1 GLPGLI family protein [Myroides odoratimimus]STZ47102.1 GLPGLI family protein [Myroides odoratimimus]